MAERELNRQQFQKNKRIKRIPLVDDEYDVSLVMKIVLEENGFKVDSFTDASEALEKKFVPFWRSAFTTTCISDRT